MCQLVGSSDRTLSSQLARYDAREFTPGPPPQLSEESDAPIREPSLMLAQQAKDQRAEVDDISSEEQTVGPI
jgi:hypothetical protein